MGLTLDYIEGQTPLDEDEKEGLLIKTISTRGELDAFEQANIQEAIEWSITGKVVREQILSEAFILNIHKKMFESVWNWAGKIRKTNKNIGVDKTLVSIELRKLLDDCTYWIEKGIFPPDEIAIRFSHRLVKIHVFPNGNGRHSRLMADILVSRLFDRPVFTWGHSDLSKGGTARKTYLNAIYNADGNDYESLVRFARE